MTKELEIQSLELSIRTWLSRMDEIFYIVNNEDADFSGGDFTHAEILDEYSREFTFLGIRVYNSCLVYFELKEIPLYINSFKSNCDVIFQATKGRGKELVRMKYEDIYTEKSRVTEIFRELLYPFCAFSSGDEAHLTGWDYLESILNSTNVILADKNIKPAKEVDVYTPVKVVIEATFSNSRVSFPGGKHKVISQIAKCYIPDVLIPDLNCAIEFKFAMDEKKLNETMDQVLGDVSGYANDNVYRWFYAVFYVKTGALSSDRFKLLWNSKNFPLNWKPIFVEGPTLK